MDHHEPTSSSLSFTIETFDDPETGQLTQYGRFSRNWQDDKALDLLIDKLEAGQLSHKQALMQARKLEATTPYNLEIQNFIANRLWALGLQDEATEVYERAYKQALAHIPKGFKGQITWGEVLIWTNQPALPAPGARHPAGVDAPAGQSQRGRSRDGAGQADAGLVPDGQHRCAFFAG
jgi:hypothetical protein